LPVARPIDLHAALEITDVILVLLLSSKISISSFTTPLFTFNTVP
jgi:hypothetical protein